MSDVRVVSPRETVIEVDAHAVPGRPGVVTPGLRVLHDGAVDAATAAATSASNAASSASAAQDARTGAVAAASAADDAMQAASGAASDADQSRVGAAASALAASAAEQAAVAAQEGLVAARDAAASSASSAATSASEAVSSASSAATAQTGAEAARGAAEAAADTAETASNQAVTARNEAVTAKTLAEGFAGDAETALTSTLAAAVYELRGKGQPGSSAATNNALPGTYYTDTAGTAGAWRWLKTTAGSGSNKWTVVHGDTGWRNISADLINGWSGTVLIRRVGQTISIEVNDLYATAATSNIFYAAPTGYRARGGSRRMLYLITPSGQWCRSDWNSSNITVEGHAETWRVRGSLTTLTNDPWPSVLPGTPA